MHVWRLPLTGVPAFDGDVLAARLKKPASKWGQAGHHLETQIYRASSDSAAPSARIGLLAIKTERNVMKEMRPKQSGSA